MSNAKVAGIVAVLWVCAMLVQLQLDKTRHYYSAHGKTTLGEGLRNNMFGASFFGMREVVAGMLWVKADELFHEGKYQELVPYFSLVTFLDPHQVDVYSTGAWHLMYNFGDPRMVPQGLAFLDEGVKNNPHVWDLYFQVGWTNFDWPVEDYFTALPAFVEADKHRGTDGTPPPPYISHMVAHALMRQGNIDACIAQWQKNYSFAVKNYEDAVRKKDQTEIGYWQQERDVCRNNRDRVITRQAYRRNLPQRQKTITISLKTRKAEPRVVEVYAKLNGMPVMRDDYGEISNARVEIVLQDKDYDKLVAAHSHDFAWIGKHLTRFRSLYNIVEANGTVTERGKPVVKIELNKDPMLDPPRNPLDLYPLDSNEYELIVRLDPRVRRQPEAVQDKLGWIGEGISAKSDFVPGKNGARVIEKRIVLKKDDIT
jgi:hypothetical protein